MLVRVILVSVSYLCLLGCLAGSFRFLRRKRLIDDVPTSKAQGVFIGLAELKGTAESEEPLTGFLSGSRCVYYKWQVDEHWSRTVVESYTDSQGQSQTRTRTESGWTKVAGSRELNPFYLKDDSGIIRIVPEGAEIQSIKTFDKTCSPRDALYYGKGPLSEIANSTHRRRFYESAIPLHNMLYVVGQARERQDVVAAEIAKDKNSPMFLISTRQEKHISKSYAVWYWVLLVLGLLAAAAYPVIEALVTNYPLGLILTSPAVLYPVGIYLLAFSAGWTWTVYNSLINLHHMVEQGWSQVDIQLKRRHDLIPNLAAAVQGYSSHERETQELLAGLRNQADSSPFAGKISGIAGSVKAIVEKYPELKAGESFLKLQKDLVDTEQRIALARDYYNGLAAFYNTRLEIIPDRFVGMLASLHPCSHLSATDLERAPVPVKLAA